MIVETIEYKNHTIEIQFDECAESPRINFDPIGTMICFAKKYNLGDKHEYNSDNYAGWDEMEKAICKENNAICLPIYMYSHSGITINTTGFGCPWDSGQIGFIFMEKERYKEEWNKKRISKKKIYEILKAEVEEYDQYLRGEVYGYVIKNKNNDETDSCWGFYGETDIVIQEAKNLIDCQKPELPYQDPRQLQLALAS